MRIKKLLALALSFSMAVTLLTVTPLFSTQASAAGNVCKIGSTEYASLSDAVAAVADGETIVMTADTTETSRINPKKKYSFTITDDGKPHTIYLANGTTDGYGRGFQLGNDSYSPNVTIKSTSTGGLTFDGEDNYGIGILVYNGTLTLDGIKLVNFYNHYTTGNHMYGGALSVGYGSNKSGYATIKDCSFSGNAASYGSDIYFCRGSLSFTGKNSVEELYIANSKTISIDDSFSNESDIFIDSDPLILGAQVVTGSISRKNFKCFGVGGGHEISPDGIYQVEQERDVVKIGDTTYDFLEDAVEAASSGDTIEVVKDFSIGESFSINKDLTITDDGNTRSINIYAEVDIDADVTFASSSGGKLCVNGYEDEDYHDTTYTGYLFALNSSSAKLTIDNVGVDYCCNGFISSTYEDAKIVLKNFDFTNFNINTQYAINSQGYLYLSGQVNIVDNNYSSNNANLAISSKGSKTIITDDLTGDISIGSSCVEGEVFATKDENADVSKVRFTSDFNRKLSVKYQSSTELSWYLPKYKVSTGDAEFDKTNGTYSYPDAFVTVESTQTAVNISVDSGYFELPQSASINVTKSYGLNDKGVYSSYNSINTDQKYTSLTIFNLSSFDSDSLTAFFAGIKFYPEKKVAQTLTVSAGYNVTSDQAYFLGSTYSISSDQVGWSTAKEIASQNESYLIEINSREENDIVSGFFNTNAWTAGAMQLNAWYWISEETTQFASSATTKEGIGGVYTNWADNEPASDGDRLLLNASGKWSSESSLDNNYYITEAKDKTSFSFTAQEEAETTILRAYDFSYDGDISMTYYFDFGEDVGDDGYIGVIVDSEETKYPVSEIKANDIKDSFGDYGIKVNLPAKKIKAKVYFVAYNGEQETERAFGVDRNYGYGPYVYMTSYIRNYDLGNHNRYGAVFTQDGVDLVKGLLNYGAAAQLQFDYKKTDLANTDYEDEEWNNIPSKASFTESYMNYMQGSSLIKSIALTAESNTRMLVYLDSGVTSVSVDGKSVNVLQDGDGKYIEISVNFQNFSHIYTISTGDCTLQINTYKLLELLVNNLTEEAPRRTAYMLYKYAKKSAKFHGEIEVAGSNVEAVVNTAYAYLNKEKNTQYDQLTLLGQEGSRTSSYAKINDYSQSRRQLYLSPEEISSQNISYLDCSSFVYNVYRDAFGDDVYIQLGLTITGMSTSNMIQVNNYSIYSREIYSSSTSTYNSVLDEISGCIQPGDWLVYYGDGGHVMFWTGTGFIHATSSSIVSGISNGGSYKYTTNFVGYDNIEAGGAVHYVTIDEMKANPSTFFGAHYNYYTDLSIKVLRPLKAISSSLTNNAKARQQLGGMGVEITARDTTKSTDLYRGQSVVSGDTITYTLKVSNNEYEGNIVTPDRTVDVSYTLPTGLSAVSASDGKVYGNTVMWSGLTVAAGDTKTLTFTATVTASAGTKLSGGSGKVSLVSAGQNAVPLSFSHREIEVDNQVDSTTYSTIKKTSTKSGIVGGLDYVKAFFTDLGYSFDITSTQIQGTSGILKSYYTDYYQTNWNAAKINYVSDKMVGGRFVANVSTEDSKTKPRNITTDNLQIGDVIVVYDNANSGRVYYWIYVGNNYMIQTYSGYSITQKINATSYLTKLNDADYYVVLRVLGR